MKKITIEVETTNDAFGLDNVVQARNETARILEDLSAKLKSNVQIPKKLFDVNGNSVGFVKVKV
jgi:hypothetical protein